MTPQERQEFETLKKTVQAIYTVRDVSFIEECKRRFVEEAVADALLTLRLGDLSDVTDDATTGQVIKKQADGTWQGANDNTT